MRAYNHPSLYTSLYNNNSSFIFKINKLSTIYD